MDKREFLGKVRDCGLNRNRIDKIEKIYSHKVKDSLGAVISLAGEVDFFDDERRLLSFDEMSDPAGELEYDFATEGLIPVIDAYDNTFIVYSFEDDMWAKFNTTDGVLFKKKSGLEEIL